MGDARLGEGNKLGRFEIIRLISVGGMGEVYLAKDDQLGRNVAIKVLNDECERDEKNLQRFIQEAKAASALNHPNILTIHEIGEKEGSHFIVSEYVEGHTLRTVIHDRKLSLSEALDISIQIAEALSAAHMARIIHRDVKPENIIVRSDDYVKVVDFGLAKLMAAPFAGLDDETVRQNQTADGLIVGTVSYMSPEQAKGEKLDERTDIFSLGVVIYEILTGRTPFGADSISESFANLINSEPEPLSRFCDVPDDVQRTVSKMLRKKADARYQTMKGLLADLREIRDGLAAGTSAGRASLPEGERVTAVLPATTGDGVKITTEAATIHRPWYRRPITLTVPIILLGIAAFGWYSRQASVEPQPQIKSLAVLPLRSLDSQDDVLGLGIADAVIRRLSQTGAVTVRPTSSVRRYVADDADALTAARQLTAEAVLEGNFQRASDRLRVSVNLLRVADGASLWAESFDMRATDIFTIQDNVAQQVASRLQLRLNAEQQARLTKHTTSNPIAYEYFVRGVYSWDQRGFGQKAKPQIDATIDLFKKAVDADPNYALARARLAYAYVWKALYVVSEEQAQWAELGKEELKRAEALDAQLADIHVVRAWLKFSGYEGWKLDEANRELLLAQQLDPNLAHGDLAANYYHVGLDDLAEREYQRAFEIDPTSEFLKNQYVLFCNYTARWDDHLAAMQKYFPGESPGSFYFFAKGHIDEAQKVIDENAVKEPDSEWLPDERAMLYAQNGDNSAAEAQLALFVKSLDKRYPYYHHATYDIACIYAVMGKTGEAMKWLRETADTGFPSYTTFERDRFLDRIRETPEFIGFMAEMKEHYEKRRTEFH